jgi:hypothetical protein
LEIESQRVSRKAYQVLSFPSPLSLRHVLKRRHGLIVAHGGQHVARAPERDPPHRFFLR